MSETKAIPCTIFDHVVWKLQDHEGSPRRAEIMHGECLLLFTSLDALQTYVNGCDDLEEGQLKPVVFSRNRKEFGRAAKDAIRTGVVGALFDPGPIAGEAPFLQFSRCDK
jgi:hypothetical protein